MADTGDDRIRLSFEGPLATICIARPEKYNALDYGMVLALERAALLIEANRGIRAAIITGEGEKSFCAGGDIEAWSALDGRHDYQDVSRDFSDWAEYFVTIKFRELRREVHGNQFIPIAKDLKADLIALKAKAERDCQNSPNVVTNECCLNTCALVNTFAS